MDGYAKHRYYWLWKRFIYPPVKDGFSNNELINYKVYSWSVQRSYDAIVTCNNSLPSTCLNFIANGLSGLETLNSSGFYLVIEASSEDVCQGESVQLNAIPSGGSGNYSYSWTSAPEGFTSNIPNPSVTPQVTTILVVRLPTDQVILRQVLL